MALKFYKRKIPEKEVNKINKLIKLSDDIYNIDNTEIVFDKKVNPRNNGTEKRIYIPLKYSENEDGIYSILKKSFGEKYQEIIIFHEMGHSVENDRKNNLNLINIKNSPDLNYLFNGSAIPNKINNFLQEVFKEGFADCYSGLCYYKKYGDINVFEKISETREVRYQEMKKEFGNNYIHPNFNIEAPRIFKSIIEDLKLKGIDILNLPFTPKVEEDNIEKYLEKSVIQGCIKSLIRELENNDAFLNHFRKFSNEFTQESNGKYKITQYDDSIKEYAKNNGKLLTEVVKDLNEKTFLPYFIEFQRKNNESYVSKDLINYLIENPKFKRNLDNNLVLKDVKEITYSAGIEKQHKENKPKVSSMISMMRNKAFPIENNNFHIKIIK